MPSKIRQKSIRSVIVGASGYTGAELIRLLSHHPHVTIAALVADSNAGKPVAEVLSHLEGIALPDLVALSEVRWKDVDVAFCCLPHGTSQEVIAGLAKYTHLKIIDLSADFRLEDRAAYAEWYGHPHRAPALQKLAVYGLTERHRKAIAKARLVACPGCYPTCTLLPLLPLIDATLIDPESILIDAKSGISGAGRAAKVENLYAETDACVRPYGIGKHRHMAEIDQELSLAAGIQVHPTFTPHIVPMSRGMLATIYVQMTGKTKASALRKALVDAYKDEPFIHITRPGVAPHTRMVTGTNRICIGVFEDRVPGRAILVSVLDNLGKGASGQAIQNMNLLCGFPEDTGLSYLPLVP